MTYSAIDVDHVLKSLASQSIKQGSNVRAAVRDLTLKALQQRELTLDQILFMRPVPSWGGYAMPIDGLYLGGAGAHPGPGVLGGAGYLAARTALKK